jgi:phosphate transport system substrate-binding protein
MHRTATALILAGAAALGVLSLSPQRLRAQQTATVGTLAIIVHRSNPVDELSSAQLKRIYMFDMQNWPHGRKITVMVREKGQPERAEAIRLICGIAEAEYERHVLLQTFRGSLGPGPRSIQSVSAMLRFVFNAPGAIGYIPADEIDSSVKVLRIDGLRPTEPAYPLRRSNRVGRGD